MKNKDKKTIVAELEIADLEKNGSNGDGGFEGCRPEDEDEILEIRLEDEDFEKQSESRVHEDSESSDTSEKSDKKRRGLKKKKKKSAKITPSETALQERAVISFVFGLLSCSVFMGNPILALLAIGVALSTKRYKYKSVYSTVGIFAGLGGLILSLIPILIFAFVVLVIVALCLVIIVLGLMEIFLLLIAVVLFLIINPVTELLVDFFVGMILPTAMCAGFLL